MTVKPNSFVMKYDSLSVVFTSAIMSEAFDQLEYPVTCNVGLLFNL